MAKKDWIHLNKKTIVVSVDGKKTVFDKKDVVNDLQNITNKNLINAKKYTKNKEFPTYDYFNEMLTKSLAYKLSDLAMMPKKEQSQHFEPKLILSEIKKAQKLSKNTRYYNKQFFEEVRQFYDIEGRTDKEIKKLLEAKVLEPIYKPPTNRGGGGISLPPSPEKNKRYDHMRKWILANSNDHLEEQLNELNGYQLQHIMRKIRIESAV